MSQQLVDREDYWTSFYAAKSRGGSLMPPSQFAAFVAQELDPKSAIFDVGCGNGRDSLFFAEMGFKVVALDASENAISFVENKASERDLDNIKFIVSDINGPKLQETIGQLENTKACIYARFFLHAINKQEQATFLETLSGSLKSGNRLAFEYRTTEDQFLQKEAPPHFRRYQSAADLNRQLQNFGFEQIYAIEGQGYAKYKTDDAIVARCIFEKR
jgi:cyclopropane fatty-acyl-phospholipid synthase-like methyltransferase